MSRIELIEGKRFAGELVQASSAELGVPGGHERLIGRLDGAKLDKPADYAKGIDLWIQAIKDHQVVGKKTRLRRWQ